MTHPPEIVEAALEMLHAGRRPADVASTLAVPRRTIADWQQGRLPRRERAGSPRPIALTRAKPEAYAYLLGLYLGDGCLSQHPRGVYKLRIALDLAYAGIIAECQGAIAEILPDNTVLTRRSATNYCEVYAYSKLWPALFPQHGPGMKHQRPIVLADWQCEIVGAAPFRLLRGLIHSDGCRFVNTGRNWSHPRYAFSNRSDDIRGIFCHACDLVGLHWTQAPHTVYVSRKADVARLDEFVGPKA